MSFICTASHRVFVSPFLNLVPNVPLVWDVHPKRKAHVHCRHSSVIAPFMITQLVSLVFCCHIRASREWQWDASHVVLPMCKINHMPPGAKTYSNVGSHFNMTVKQSKGQIGSEGHWRLLLEIAHISGNVGNEVTRVVTMTQHLTASSDDLVTICLPPGSYF